MPTDLTTEKIEKLLRAKFPPKDANDGQTVFNSILLALSSRADDQERELAKLRGMVKLLTQRLVEVGIITLPGDKSEKPASPEAPVEASQAPSPEGESAPEDGTEEEEEVVRLDTKQEVKVVAQQPPPPAPSPAPTVTPSPSNGE